VRIVRGETDQLVGLHLARDRLQLGRRELFDGLGGESHLVTQDVTRLALDPRHLVAELPGEAQMPDPARHLGNVDRLRNEAKVAEAGGVRAHPLPEYGPCK
jgi:hypothetical protein